MFLYNPSSTHLWMWLYLVKPEVMKTRVFEDFTAFSFSDRIEHRLIIRWGSSIGSDCMIPRSCYLKSISLYCFFQMLSMVGWVLGVVQGAKIPFFLPALWCRWSVNINMNWSNISEGIPNERVWGRAFKAWVSSSTFIVKIFSASSYVIINLFLIGLFSATFINRG